MLWLLPGQSPSTETYGNAGLDKPGKKPGGTGLAFEPQHTSIRSCL